MNNNDLKYIEIDHFNLQEFANSLDGNKIKLNLDLVFKMNELRKLVGRSITVTSGYRTPDFNRREGGSSNSYHVQGLACDCRFNFGGYTQESLIAIAKYLGFKNIGFYWERGKIGGTLNRLHLDIGKPHNGKNFCVMNWHTNGRFINKY